MPHRFLAPRSLGLAVACLGIGMAGSLARAAPALESASTVKTHGAAGELAIDLPLVGPRGIETRELNGNLTVRLSFDQAVSNVTAAVAEGEATINGAPVVAGSDVTVQLSGVGGGQYVTLDVTARDAGGDAATYPVTVGLLKGDVMANAVVNILDLFQVRSQLGLVPTPSTAAFDLRADGTINLFDFFIVRSTLASRLPATPPMLDVPATVTVDAASGVETVNFNVDDFLTPPSGLSVTATTGNGALLPQSGLSVSGTGHARTLSITPAPGAQGSANVTVSVSDGGLTTQRTLDVAVSVAPVDGVVTRDVWYGSFASVDAIPTDTPADLTEQIDILQIPQSTPNVDRYGQRLRGYIIPPVSGDYTFFVAGDDAVRFSMSNSDEPNDVWMRSDTSVFTAFKEWGKRPSQKSPLLRLTGGEKYYFEVLHLEGAGNDHVAVGWYAPTGQTVPTGGAVSVIGADHIADFRPGAPLDGGTLYTSTLRPTNPTSLGSGQVILVLADDQNSARFRYTHSNLTGPITNEHIHAADGTILFDIDDAEPDMLGWYDWQITGAGPYSKADVLAFLTAGQTYLNLHTAQFPQGEITGYLGRTAGSTTFTPPAPPPGVSYATGDRDVYRLLTQATYGATSEEMQRVKQLGVVSWVDDQLAKPFTSFEAYFPSTADPATFATYHYLEKAFYNRSLKADDQLRQRVAFALMELFVISRANAEILFNRPRAVCQYMDILGDGAFGNFRDLLEDVTLSVPMGRYLNMLGNDKEDPATGQVPNENYARELIQLFSIGLNRTHPDGTLLLGADGLPIPNYEQDTVVGLARVCTGWDLDWNSANQYGSQNWKYVDLFPMKLYGNRHENGTKLLLNNVVQPASQGGAADLDVLLDQIFNHPNVGPFVATHLIKRLVTSNPSPGYVHRVAGVFDDNGSGVRGDMKAVVRAVLLDYEARNAADENLPGYGKVKEPLIAYFNLMRAFGLDAPPEVYPPEWAYSVYVGQQYMTSPTVFNFFMPDYSPSGDLAKAGLTAPELQIIDDSSSIGYGNAAQLMAYNGFNVDGQAVRLDYADEVAIAADAGALVDRVSLLLTGGPLSADLRAKIIDAVDDKSGSSPAGRRDRVEEAVWLISLTPHARIQN